MGRDAPSGREGQRERGDGVPKIAAGVSDSRPARQRLTAFARFGVSPRRAEGWEPQERHDHFDADDNLTGYTVVTREPEWDDNTRGRALRLQEYEDSIDRTTNLPVDIAFNPNQAFAVDTVVNHAHAVQQKHERSERKTAEEKNGGRAPDGWNDGHRYVVRIPTPDEIAKDGRGD